MKPFQMIPGLRTLWPFAKIFYLWIILKIAISQTHFLHPGMPAMWVLTEALQKCVYQGCNFVNFSRGHVGPWNKNLRSPHEKLRAHNEHDEIRFISVKIPKQFNCWIIFYSYTYVNWLKAHWKSSLDPGLSTLKLSIIHVKQFECCKSAPVFEFATSLYQVIRCHTRHKILFYKIHTFTVQVTKMDACVVKQYEWRICILTIHPMIPVVKWATRFWFLVTHRQDLVALASGRAVICNPVY